MKKQIILAVLATAFLAVLPACTTVEPAPQTHTSTTSTTETSVHRPVSSATVESTSVRSY